MSGSHDTRHKSKKRESELPSSFGGYLGAVSVLCFLSPPGAGTAGLPIKKLVGFDRVYLQPAASASVKCNLTASDFSEPLVPAAVPAQTGMNSGPAVAEASREVLGGKWKLQFGATERYLALI